MPNHRLALETSRLPPWHSNPTISKFLRIMANWMTPRPVPPLISVTAPSFTCNMHLTCSLLSRAMYPWILDQPRTALSPPRGVGGMRRHTLRTNSTGPVVWEKTEVMVACNSHTGNVYAIFDPFRTSSPAIFHMQATWDDSCGAKPNDRAP